MRRFTTLCKDNITGCEMIFSECSFNQALAFLESENVNDYFENYIGKCKRIEEVTPKIRKLVFEDATFMHDEIRGYLMRVE